MVYCRITVTEHLAAPVPTPMRRLFAFRVPVALSVAALSVLGCEHAVDVSLHTGSGSVELLQGGSAVLPVTAEVGTVITFTTGANDGLSVSPNPVTVDANGFVGMNRPNVSATVVAPPGMHEIKVSATNTNNGATKTEIVPMFVTVREPFSFSAASSTTVIGRAGQIITGAATTNRDRDFTGQINYSITGLPPALSVSLIPTKLPLVETLDYRIDAPITFSAGTYPAQITATSNGVTKIASLSVVVLERLPAPDYSIQVLPSVVQLLPSSSTVVDVTLKRTGSPIIGDISLAITELPANVTANFSPSVVSETISRLTLTSNNAAPTGPVTLTIVALGGGVGKTATVTLSVSSGIVITALPASITLTGAVTQPVDVAVNVTRTGAVGDVTIEATGVPVGVTATVSPSVLVGNVNASVVHFTANGLTPPGSYTVTIRGFGERASFGAAVVTLVVAAPPAVTFTPAFNTAAFTAPQGQISAVQLNLPRTGAGVGAPLTITVTEAPPLSVAVPALPTTTATVAFINLTVGSTVPIESHRLSVSVTDGVTTQTASITIIVTAPPAPSFTISATPIEWLLPKEQFKAFAIVVSPIGGFAAPITFSVVNPLPGNMIIDFATNPTSAGFVTVNIYASPIVVPGTYVIPFTGTSGSIVRTVNVPVVVGPPAAAFAPTFSQASYSVAPGLTATLQLNLGRTLPLAGVPSTISITASPPTSFTQVLPPVTTTLNVTAPMNGILGVQSLSNRLYHVDAPVGRPDHAWVVFRE